MYRITTRAGNGAPGYAGDGGPAAHAILNWPRDIALEATGVLYIADTLNHCIRRVDARGHIATVAGIGQEGYQGEGGPALRASFSAPRGIAIAADGTLFICDTGNHCLRRIDPDGRITTLAGTGEPGYGGDGIPGKKTQLNWPAGVVVANDGSVLIADSANHRIRRITPDGTISTLAGTGEAGYGGDGGLATHAHLTCPRNLTVGPEGTIYIGDTENNRIRQITLDGNISTFAGTGEAGYDGDGGKATAARLHFPRGVAVGPGGNVFIADCDNSVLRRVSPEGIINTIAGTGIEGYTGDDGPALKAQLRDPHGLICSPNGVLYTAEPRASCIRMIWPQEAPYPYDPKKL